MNRMMLSSPRSDRVRLLAVVAVLSCLGLAAAAGAAAPRPVPGRVIVSFEPGVKVALDKSGGAVHTGLAGLDAVLARHGVTRMEPLFGGMIDAFEDPAVRADLARHYVVEFTAKAGNGPLLRELGALAPVAEAESDMELPLSGTAYDPNDLSSSQWYLRNSSMGGADIHAVGGWAESLGDSNVVVAVCDTGVDWHHPDLGGIHPDKVNGALWTNWTEYYGTPGVDDDGNGFVDDIRGWDFVNVSSSSVYPGEDYGPADNDPMDFAGHGTNVAGCIAPLTDNGLGIAGTAPGCKIMALRIGFLTPTGDGVSYSTLMAAAFVYAAANGADVVNLSFSTSFSSSLSSAVNAVLSAGGIICNSAGNDDTNVAGYLGTWSDPRVLSVAATNTLDAKASFSNYGTWVDVSAPGTGIYTTAYDWTTDSSTYTTTQGTSFASPIAAGCLALIWSAHPELTAFEVVARMLDNCDDIDAVNPGYEGELGAGRVNLLRALGDNVQQFPQEFPTLFDALNSAAAGDTIKILGSAVLGGVLVPDTGLQVLGGWDASYTTRDVVGGRTQISASAGGTGLSFFGDADSTTVVDGFRISGGGGVFYAGLPYGAKYGGGVILNGDSPTLRNIEITGCSVGSTSQLGCGGGIMLHASHAVLENVHIHGNTGIYGAGLFAYDSAPTLIDCVIENNVVIPDNASYPPAGGGIHLRDTDLTLVDCTVSGHTGLQLGGGIYAAAIDVGSTLDVTGGVIAGNTALLSGGGIHITDGAATLKGILFDGNGRTPAATFMHGGGLFASAATVSADSLTFTGNDAHVGAGAEFSACPQADLTNSVLAGNDAVFWGGAVAYDANTMGAISGNTMTGNHGGAGGAGLYLANCSPAVNNNISAFNTGAAAYANGMALLTAPSLLACNDVFGNDNADWSGVPDPTGTDGNISADPLFCDAPGGNYNVAGSSPCDPGVSGACGLIGALGDGCGVMPVPDPGSGVPTAFRVEQNYPNPFNPTTKIRFAVPTAGRTEVAVFDVAGRLVKTLLDDDLPASVHEVVWSGEDAHGRPVSAGIYFYLVTHGSERSVGRMALVK